MIFFIDTLGCPKALIDAERIAYFMQKAGHILTMDPDRADCIIINTCGFIEEAKQESINTILHYAENRKKTNPEAKIIASGCLTERYRNELSSLIPEIDSMLGVRDPKKILEAVKTPFLKECADKGSYQDETYIEERNFLFSEYRTAYLKISEGCNRSCAFCAIPGIRGPQRNRKPENIIKEAQYLYDNGFQELIIISEDTAAYQYQADDNPENQTGLIELLEKIDRIPFHTVRLLYLFPDKEIIFPLIEWIAVHPRTAPYFDIPFQHGSPSVLRKMNRPDNVEDFKEIIRKIRKDIPEAAIRSTFITGYPGETEEDFHRLCLFLTEFKLDRAGFFGYSDEEGTSAEKLEDKIEEEIIRERVETCYEIQKKISSNLLHKQVGKKTDCIWTGQTEEIDGKTFHICRDRLNAPEIDGKIYLKTGSDEIPEDITPAFITGLKGDYDLYAEEIREEE